MTDEAKEKFRRILEAFAVWPFDGYEKDWEAVAASHEIGLPASYARAVYEAVRQGRWRTAENPAAYVYAVARIEGRKMGFRKRNAEAPSVSDLPAVRDREGRPLSHDEHMERLCYRHCPDEPIYTDEEGRSMDRPYSQAILKLDEPGAEDAHPVRDWDKVAKLSRLDKGERQVLAWWLIKGNTREEFLNGAKNEEGRRERRASWRRFERKFPKIRAIISGLSSTGYGAQCPQGATRDK
jgi:hypothetical protein